MDLDDLALSDGAVDDEAAAAEALHSTEGRPARFGRLPSCHKTDGAPLQRPVGAHFRNRSAYDRVVVFATVLLHETDEFRTFADGADAVHGRAAVSAESAILHVRVILSTIAMMGPGPLGAVELHPELMLGSPRDGDVQDTVEAGVHVKPAVPNLAVRARPSAE